MTQIVWNQQTRYRPYIQWSSNYLRTIQQKVEQSIWRTNTHIQPVTGLLNDPCAFNFFNGQWHLFYQSFPFGPVHGLKSWYHLVSTDLLHWQPSEQQLLPDGPFDHQGVYTGSGYVADNHLQLLYTGNVRDSDWNRHSYQMHAQMDRNGVITKSSQPIIATPPSGYTAEFRDPFAFSNNNERYCLIGGQTTTGHGAILLYHQEPNKEWKFLGPLAIPTTMTGYMVECPNIDWVDNHVVLTFCPQGLDHKTLSYTNRYPNVAMIADDFDPSTRQFSGEMHLQLVDYGCDFYASRTTVAPDGRHLLIGWMGMPESEYPSDRDQWANCLSYPRELHVKNGKLQLAPLSELEQLREDEIVPDATTFNFSATAEFEFNTTSQTEFSVYAKGLESLKLSVTGQKLSIISAHATRHVQLPNNTNHIVRLFIDGSAYECYVDDGEVCLTGRFFPQSAPDSAIIKENGTDTSCHGWRLERSNH
ncbi:sucrose-6-phosphate hydrolase [Lacticaseibacillus zhaodongensis]|uniref:sucrose-6-phosphate hydrolase n=1 Tax=Lacticaseibacillus zhaodongensis TaxID=2668065 RepID=UPI0012D2A169|nr:sucrose-6-phosphate hydrolase [Lacticaseibacillus zhaodongensis]